MSVYMGIDIGGTGSRWCVVDADGNEVGRGACAGATGHLFADAPRGQFETVLDDIATATAGYGISAIEAGITGLGRTTAETARRLVSAKLGTAVDAVFVADDIELAFRVRFAPGGGHLIAAGTGSVGIHVTAAGQPVRVGGRGLLIDDAGSGTWIALRALDLVYRDIDRHGVAARTGTLAAALFEAVGGQDWDSVRSYIYGNDRGRIGALATSVAAAADAGDATAHELLRRAGEELARLGNDLIARCGPAPVAVMGRIPALSPIIRESLKGRLEEADVRFDSFDPALGAAMLARDRIGLTTPRDGART